MLTLLSCLQCCLSECKFPSIELQPWTTEIAFKEKKKKNRKNSLEAPPHLQVLSLAEAVDILVTVISQNSSNLSPDFPILFAG